MQPRTVHHSLVLLLATITALAGTGDNVSTQDFTPQIIQLTDTALGVPPFLGVPTISRDGSAVAFLMAHTEDDVRLYIARGDGAGPQQLTPTGFCRRGNSPTGFPTTFGTKLVFIACENSAPCSRGNLGAPGDIYVVGLGGALPTRLTFDGQPSGGIVIGPWYEQAIISADGTKVAFTTSNLHPTEFRRFMTLFVINADGTGRQELVLPTSSLPAGIKPLSFSSDNSEIAFVYDDGPVVNIGAIRTDGTGFRILTNAPPGEFVLSGDWTTLAYVGSSGLSMVKTDGTGFTVLDTAPTGQLSPKRSIGRA